jgi:hypothetical protein
MPLSDPFGFDAPPLNVAPTPAQPSAKEKWGKAAPILAMIPLILQKGGPQGLAMFLAARQQAQEQKRQQGTQEADRQAQLERQAMLDERAGQQQQAQQQYQQGQLANQTQQQRTAFLDKFTEGLRNVSTPEEAQSLVEAYAQFGAALNVSRESLDKIARQVASTERLTEKRVQSLLKTADKDQLQQMIAGELNLMVDGKAVPFVQWSKHMAVATDPNTGKPITAKKPEADAPNTDYGRFLARFAKERGKTFDTLTVAEEAEAKKMYGQADDRITINTGTADARSNTRIDRIVSAFNAHPLVKEYNETQAQQGILHSVVNGKWSGPADMAAVFAFMKALDPNSVVRETEYANAAKSGNIFMGWAARFNGAVSPNGGFLSEQVRRDFLNTINARMEVKSKQYQNLRTQLSQRIDRIKAGAPETGDEALVDYASGSGQAPPNKPQIEAGREYNHPQLGRVRVVGANPDGTVKVEKVQ